MASPPRCRIADSVVAETDDPLPQVWPASWCPSRFVRCDEFCGTSASHPEIVIDNRLRGELRLTVTAHLTLDGVMQSNGKPEPELNDGFEQGGWQVRYSDEDMDRLTQTGLPQPPTSTSCQASRNTARSKTP